jgi:hypothetical protein
VADVDGFTTFFTDFAMGQNLESGASIFNHRRKAQKGVNVTVVDLSRLIRGEVSSRVIPPVRLGGLSHPRPPAVVMKLDVEGAEVRVLPHMLMQGTLCKPHVDVITTEWHGHLVVGEKEKDRLLLLREHLTAFLAMDPVHCVPTLILEEADESYFASNFELNC